MEMKFVWLAWTNPKPYCDALDVSINDSIGFSIANPLEKYCKKLVLTVGMTSIAAGSVWMLVCVLIGRYTRINHFTSTTTTSNGQNKVIRSNSSNNNNNNNTIKKLPRRRRTIKSMK